MINRLSLCLILSFTFYIASAQQTNDSLLSVERIFASHEFVGSHRNAEDRWEDDGSAYLSISSSKDSTGGMNIIRINTTTGDTSIVIDAHDLIPSGMKEPLWIENYEFSVSKKFLLIYTNSRRVWRQRTRGDYWIFNLQTKQLRELHPDAEPSSLMFAKISPDEKHVAYVCNHNIFIEDVLSAETTQLTFDGSDTIINGTFDWVYEEEFDLRDGFRWSLNGQAIAFWQLDASGIGVYDMLNTTDSIYSKVIPVQYPKVGTQNSACRVGVVSLETKKIVWMKSPGDPRNTYIARMDWTPDSHEIMIEHLNRQQNFMQLIFGNPATGEMKTILSEKDSAWIDVVDNVEWMHDGKEFLWTSERSGWRHPYIVSRYGSTTRDLIDEPYDMISVVTIDKTNDLLYFYASPDNAAQQYLYRVSISKKEKPVRITPAAQPGWHSYIIDPSGEYSFHDYSSFVKPQSSEIISLPQHSTIRTLFTNAELVKKLSSLTLGTSEFLKVDAAGTQLDAWCIKPPDFDSSKKYPVIFYVYCEPAAQTVLDRWGGSTYLWHVMMSQKGYIVISIDNRGTPAPRGSEFRKCIYEKIGTMSSSDQANSVITLLTKFPFIDSNRVGVWGWSGGGSSTLNAMFKYPDIYKTGVAVAAVSNEKFYDTIYEERYMGLLPENDSAYVKASAITYANNLKGNLLIIHGTGDDNVHYQNCEALINELVKNNKQFSLMSYPNRTHGIFERTGTTLHLWTTITNFFLKNL